MKLLSPSLILVIMLALSCSGNVHQTPSNQEQALSQTRSLIKAHIQGHYNADAKAASEIFDNDVQFYGEDDAAYLSRSEIQQYYESVYEKSEFKKASYTPSDFNVTSNTAIEIGDLTLSMKPKNGNSDALEDSSQKYMLIWENDIDKGNSWTITRAMMVDLEQ